MTSKPTVQLAACVLCTLTGVLAGHALLLWRLGADTRVAPTAPDARPILADHPPADHPSADPLPLPGGQAPPLMPPPPKSFRPLARAAAEDTQPFPLPDHVAPRPARPEPLPEPQHALPLRAKPVSQPNPSAAVGGELRGMIARELPGLTDEEVQIWAEELHGLPPDVAREILRFRGAIGREPLAEPALPSVEPTRPVPPPLELPPLELPPSHPSRLAPGHPSHLPSSLAALRQAIAVTLNNLANADTPGFKRVELIWSDRGYEHAEDAGGATVSVGTGARLATRLDVSPGPLRKSARNWDWAVNGRGFFCVRDGEALRYTRSGWFSPQDGRIVLRTGSGVYPLEPPVAWPADVLGVDVLPDGTIVSARTDDSDETTPVGRVTLTRFDAPELLRPVGGLLYEATPAAGEPQTAKPGQSGCGTVVIHRLEGSNVDWDQEYEQLTRLKHRLECLTRIAGAQDHEPPPRPVAIRPPAVAEPSPVRMVGGADPRDDQADAWFKKYIQSEKARLIERNLGID